MRALIFKGPRRAEIELIDRFEPAENEAIVRVRAAAVCTTERRIYAGELKLPFPIIGGHEVAGVVEWVGDKDAGLKPGDHVIIDTAERCARCYYCLRGYSNLCINLKPFKKNYLIIGGGFAEYVTLPIKSIFKISPRLSFEEASLCEPLACCLHSIKKAELGPGDSIVIIGAGTMGAIHLLLARLYGARAIVCDVDEKRLKFARRLGADFTINPAKQDAAAAAKDYTDARGADAVFITASSKEAGDQALAMVGRLGRVVLYASTYPPAKLELDWNRIHYQEITLTGTEGKTPGDLQRAAALLSSGAIGVKPLISRVIGLEELPEELGKKPTGETQRVVVRI